jgi:glucose-1-phosphate thymidylyltransferase
VACPEEVALNMGYITPEDVRRIGREMERNEYGQYLLRLVGNKPSF